MYKVLVTIEEVVREYRQMIFAIAIRIVRNEAAAEDVCQETFLKIWQALPHFSHRCPLARWIAIIARNTSISRLRRESRNRHVPLEDAPELADRGRDHAHRLEIQQLVDLLPEGQRRVVDLFYYQRWPVQEIAARLAIPNATVRGRLYYARRALAGGRMLQ